MSSERADDNKLLEDCGVDQAGQTETLKERGCLLRNEESPVRIGGRPGLAAFWLALTIIISILTILSVGSFLFLPVSPSISGTFSIQTISTQGSVRSRVEIKVVTASYSREPYIRGYFGGSGTLTLPVKPTQPGTYDLTLGVAYSAGPAIEATFHNVGDGIYGFKILYAWKQESAATLYTITIRVSGQNVDSSPVSFTVSPS